MEAQADPLTPPDSEPELRQIEPATGPHAFGSGRVIRISKRSQAELLLTGHAIFIITSTIGPPATQPFDARDNITCLALL